MREVKGRYCLRGYTSERRGVENVARKVQVVIGFALWFNWQVQKTHGGWTMKTQAGIRFDVREREEKARNRRKLKMNGGVSC